MATIVKAFNHVVPLDDFFTSTTKFATIIDTSLFFQETYTVNIFVDGFSDELVISEDYHSSLARLTILDNIIFTERYAKINNYTFTDIIFLDDAFNFNFYNDLLTFTDSFIPDISKFLFNDELVIALVDSFTTQYSLTKNISDNLIFKSFFVYLPTPSNRRTGVDLTPIYGECN